MKPSEQDPGKTHRQGPDDEINRRGVKESVRSREESGGT